MATFVRVYTGSDGKSHIEDIDPPFEPFVDVEGAHGEGTPLEAASGITFRRGAPGYFLDYHNAPRRQYTITLSGEVEIGTGARHPAPLWPGQRLAGRGFDRRRPHHPSG